MFERKTFTSSPPAFPFTVHPNAIQTHGCQRLYTSAELLTIMTLITQRSGRESLSPAALENPKDHSLGLGGRVSQIALSPFFILFLSPATLSFKPHLKIAASQTRYSYFKGCETLPCSLNHHPHTLLFNLTAFDWRHCWGEILGQKVWATTLHYIKMYYIREMLWNLHWAKSQFSSRGSSVPGGH